MTEGIIKKMESEFHLAKAGEVSELETFLKLDIIAKEALKLKESLFSSAMNELDYCIEGNSKSYISNGYRFTPKQSVSYDYSAEPKLQKLKSEIASIQDNMKAACIQAEKGIIFTDEDGVIIPPAIKKHGKESITITKIKTK